MLMGLKTEIARSLRFQTLVSCPFMAPYSYLAQVTLPKNNPIPPFVVGDIGVKFI